MKIVAIGIGSRIFGLELLRDVFRVHELRGAELWLVDIDADAARRTARLAERLNAAADADIRICWSTDRIEALPGADFVVTSVAVARGPTWRADHEMALRHGFASVLSENGGPGGLSHTLRSVPLMVEIGMDVERLAPNALVLNYTNPENRVCLALRRHTSVRVVGLCHSVAESIDEAARLLERERSELDVWAAGVNHFTFFVRATDGGGGADLLPELRRRRLAAEDDGEPLRRMIIERLDAHPAIDDDHIGEYLPWAAEVIGTRGYDFDGLEARGHRLSEDYEAWSAGAKSVEPLLAEPSDEARVDHGSADIMADVLTGRSRRRPSFILPNDGLIENLPADSVVEVPGLVEAGAVKGVPVGAMPEAVAALLRHEQAIQDLAVEAALEGSRELALRALLIDPVVGSARAASAFLDEVLTRHRAYLPRFWQA